MRGMWLQFTLGGSYEKHVPFEMKLKHFDTFDKMTQSTIPVHIIYSWSALCIYVKAQTGILIHFLYLNIMYWNYEYIQKATNNTV